MSFFRRPKNTEPTPGAAEELRKAQEAYAAGAPNRDPAAVEDATETAQRHGAEAKNTRGQR